MDMSRFFNVCRTSLLLLSVAVIAACATDRSAFPTADERTVVVATEYDQLGWQGVIAVTFERDTITGVVYEEFDRRGNAKSRDQGYAAMMVPVVGIAPAQAFAALARALVELQDPAAIDAVTGATQSSLWFVSLAQQAAEQRP